MLRGTTVKNCVVESLFATWEPEIFLNGQVVDRMILAVQNLESFWLSQKGLLTYLLILQISVWLRVSEANIKHRLLENGLYGPAPAH